MLDPIEDLVEGWRQCERGEASGEILLQRLAGGLGALHQHPMHVIGHVTNLDVGHACTVHALIAGRYRYSQARFLNTP